MTAQRGRLYEPGKMRNDFFGACVKIIEISSKLQVDKQ